MKIRTTFKSPDAVSMSLEDANLRDDAAEEAEEFISRFVKYGEYVTIEFDTEKGTATVLEK